VVRVLVAGQEWTSPDGRSVVRVVELSPERAVIERVLRPGTGKAGAHLHRDWLKSYEAVDGELRIQVGKEEPRLPRRRRDGAGAAWCRARRSLERECRHRSHAPPRQPSDAGGPRAVRDAGRATRGRAVGLTGRIHVATTRRRAARRTCGQLGCPASDPSPAGSPPGARRDRKGTRAPPGARLTALAERQMLLGRPPGGKYQACAMGANGESLRGATSRPGAFEIRERLSELRLHRTALSPARREPSRHNRKVQIMDPIRNSGLNPVPDR
jgi:hypothetical protein